MNDQTPAEVFISYASADRLRVLPVADRLQAAGVAVWLDRDRIQGAELWSEAIVRAIRACKAVVLMCSDASMRSWVVRQEVLFAGQEQKVILPVLLEPTHYPEQVELFIAGRQRVDVNGRPIGEWLPAILAALGTAGVPHSGQPATAGGTLGASRREWSLEALRSVARFTDQLWPTLVRGPKIPAGTQVRGLGAPRFGARHTFRIGDRVQIVLESERAGHLLLLDEGPDGLIYCLCPSEFAPDTHLSPGPSVFPSPSSQTDAFDLTGRPGREHLLAVIAEGPIRPDWGSNTEGPARVLNANDVRELLDTLYRLTPGSWMALATYFDVTH